MIWISTICLLAIAAWLFFNALNERRWTEAHSHDETVANDPGLFPSLSAVTGSGVRDNLGKISVFQEDSKFARAVTAVQEKTSKYGEKFVEAKASAAKLDDGQERPASASEEDTFFGKAVSVVGEKVGKMDQKLDEKMKAASGHFKSSGEEGSTDESAFSRASRKVVSSSEVLTKRIADHARNASKGINDKLSNGEDGSVFGTMAGSVSKTVSSTVSGTKARISEKMDSRRENNEEDFITRIASKVGTKVNEIDDRMVKAKGQGSGLFSRVASKVGNKVNALDDKIAASAHEKSEKEDILKRVASKVDSTIKGTDGNVQQSAKKPVDSEST